ncbi:regulator of sigma E protease [Trypanosoma cruzi]|nr:regulator of sigma E protease [Trypanosoma cruzi]
MRTGTHGSFQTPLHTCNASCALRSIFPTVTEIDLAVGEDHIVKNQEYFRVKARRPLANHIAKIINSSTRSDADRGVSVDQLTHAISQENLNGFTRIQEADTLPEE